MGKNIKAALKKINWPEVLDEYKKSEQLLKIKEGRTQTISLKIEGYCLGRRENLIKNYKKRNPPDRRKQIEKDIGEIDKKLLNSYEEENILNETRAIESIKSNPKYFFTYARKKLKTRNKVGPFDIEGEKFTSF